MRTLATVFFVTFMGTACEEGEGGESVVSTPDDTATPCNEANEDCAPGTCSGEGADMLPGSQCLACHSQGNLSDDKDWEVDEAGESGEGGIFTVGGTVFEDILGSGGAPGVTIRITDATGSQVEMVSSSSGNFYTDSTLTAPLSAELERDGSIISMVSTASTGDCSSCHRCDGPAGGKLYAP